MPPSEKGLNSHVKRPITPSWMDSFRLESSLEFRGKGGRLNSFILQGGLTMRWEEIKKEFLPVWSYRPFRSGAADAATRYFDARPPLLPNFAAVTKWW